MAEVWIELPDKDMTLNKSERLKLKSSKLFGFITVYREMDVKSYDMNNEEIYGKVLHEILSIAPEGKVMGMDLADSMIESNIMSGYKGRANFELNSNNIEIEAKLSPYTLLGFIRLPFWLIASVNVEVRMNGNLVLKHIF